MREQESFNRSLEELESKVDGLHIGAVKMDKNILAEAVKLANEKKRQAAVAQCAAMLLEIDEQKSAGLSKIAELRKINKELDKRSKSIENIMGGNQTPV